MNSNRIEGSSGNSICDFFTRLEIKRDEQNQKEIAYAIRKGIPIAMENPSEEMLKLMNSNYPELPKLTFYDLASHALSDLNSPDTIGHLGITFVTEPKQPMLQIKLLPCMDCPGEESEMVAIAVNLRDPKAHFWLHANLPEDIVLSGVRTLADAAVVLASELHTHPDKILHRSEFPPAK